MRAIVMAKPYLHCHHRFKNGKDHCYWSIAEKVRTRQGWVQRHLLYLGEINDSQKAAWTKVTEVFDMVGQQTRELALYPAERDVPVHAADYGVQVRLDQFELRRPRQWGACFAIARPEGRASFDALRLAMTTAVRRKCDLLCQRPSILGHTYIRRVRVLHADDMITGIHMQQLRR